MTTTSLETGITGVAEIPGILITATDGAALQGAVAGGRTVTVTFGPSLKDASVFEAPEQVDLVASFSSRGVRQATGVKPDVAAPGVTLYSAAVGTGSQGVSESGTSMATPTTAGVTALIRAAHPEWTAEQVKADLMNTAGHDVFTGQGQTGEVYGPNRVGAGRIDAAAALRNDVLAYAEAGSGVVTASFGVVEVAQEQVQQTRTITVQNTGKSAAVYRVAYDALAEQPGVSYSLSASKVTVPPRQTRDGDGHPHRAAGPAAQGGRPDGRHRRGERRPAVPRGGQRPGGVHAEQRQGRAAAGPGARQREAVVDADRERVRRRLGDHLAGEGVANGTAFDPTSYTSLVSGFEQLGTSPELPRCASEAGADLLQVGAGALGRPGRGRGGPRTAWAASTSGCPRTAGSPRRRRP